MNVSLKKKLSLFNQEKYIKVQCIIFILNNTMLVNGGHTLSTEHAELCWKAKDNFFHAFNCQCDRDTHYRLLKCEDQTQILIKF